MDLKDPRKQKIILMVVAVIAVIYAYFVYDYAPKSREINQREVHLIGLKSHIRTARARIEKSDETKLRQELRTLERELARIEQLLPLEEEVPGLLREVENRGLQSGVSSVLFEPKEKTMETLYMEHLYRVSVRGGYHNIGLFLSLVSGMKRVISPSEVSLKIFRDNQRGYQEEEILDDVVAEFDMRTYTTITGQPESREAEEHRK